MGFGPKLAAALGIEPRSEHPVQKLYDLAMRHLFGTIATPLPQDVLIQPRNFPYLIKLQWWHPTRKQWEDAIASKIIPVLDAGRF
mgnify:CR=1 FL=1